MIPKEILAVVLVCLVIAMYLGDIPYTEEK